MNTHGIGTSGLRSEINVTPLVDVVLVLLIIFIVIMPLTLRGYDVNVAEQSTVAPQALPDQAQVVLSIDAAGCPLTGPQESPGLPTGCRVSLNGEDVLATDLPQRLAAVFSSREPTERVLFLAVQEQLNYEGVMRILDSAKSGVEGLRIGMVTESLK